MIGLTIGAIIVGFTVLIWSCLMMASISDDNMPEMTEDDKVEAWKS